MIIIPAIDLQAGRAVRLLRGDFAQETVYGDDPVAVARRWLARQASLLHVVDLDGTRAGQPVQLDLVRRIAAVGPVQVAGGIRTFEDAARVVSAVWDRRAGGAGRIVIGTAALDVPFTRELVRLYGDRLVVALDTRHGNVAVRGWTEESARTLLDLAEELVRESGVRRFLHTDVERDGTLTSPNYSSLQALIALGTPVIASGGVSSAEDIRRLRDIGAEAVIVGRALYEGTIDLEEVMAIAGSGTRGAGG
jgi:phosphoribosylformimino-5-aminoimidazole carboxamide ribotide isomerase